MQGGGSGSFAVDGLLKSVECSANCTLTVDIVEAVYKRNLSSAFNNLGFLPETISAVSCLVTLCSSSTLRSSRLFCSDCHMLCHTKLMCMLAPPKMQQ